MSRWLIVFTGFILGAVSLWSAAYAVRVAVAQTIYHEAKYGPQSRDVDAALRMCRTASSIYRYNYHCAAFAAETAYNHATEHAPSNQVYYLEMARFWSERAIALNRYLTLTRWIKARLLWRESPADAIRHWADYTAWHFWDHYNHAMLATMCAMAGDVERAEREMILVRGSEYEADTARVIEAARAASPAGGGQNTAELPE